MKTGIVSLFLTAFWLFFFAASAQDSPVRGEDFIRVPAIGEGLCVSNSFQNHMVIQRDKPVTITGWATPGEKVTVTFGGASGTTKANDDRTWTVTLESMPANSKAQSMTVQGKNERLKLEDILVGDVWILGGQSNMEFDLYKVDDGMLEVVSANFPNIRLLTIPRGKGFDSVNSFERLHEWSDWSKRHFQKGDWQPCSPDSVREFSAIGYVFGRRIHMASGVPIGLIDISAGGTTVETWTPREVVESIDARETREWVQDWANRIATYDAQEDLERRITNYENNKKNREKQGNPLPADSQPPSDLRPGPVADKNRPGYCFASMLRPLEGLSVKGAIFHQGFNNCFNGSAGARMYYQVFGKMIESWRNAFRDPKLPFCIISQCTAGEPQTHENFARSMYDVGALIREAQHLTWKQLRESGDETIGFTSSFDLRKSWYHPQIKVPAGERAAKWALVTQYNLLEGRDSEHYWLPPSITDVEIKEGAVQLQLSTEVKTADDSDGKMLGFAIAGEDRRFFPAQIDYAPDGFDNRNRPKLRKNKLVLSSPYVSTPVHYRYAWARNPMANLVNRFGIPLATQRSDDWILEETPVKLEAPEGMDNRSISRWTGNQLRKILEQDDQIRRYQEARAIVEELGPVIEKAEDNR